mgnify:CR=1 FL=1
MIKIYRGDIIRNDSNTLTFKIDKTNRKASLFNTAENIKEVIIPRTIEYESVEYLITSVVDVNKNLRKLLFVED